MQVLVFLEQRDGELKPAALEALATAQRLAGDAAAVTGLLVGTSLTAVADSLKGCGADTLLIAEDASLKDYNVMAYSQVLATAIETVKPDVVLGAASPMGRDLFPRLAARLQAGLLTDLIAIDAGFASGTKAMFAGKVLAKVRFCQDGLKFITIRPNVFSKEASGGAGAVKPLSVEGLAVNPLVTREIRKSADVSVDLTEANCIVTGGRSLGSSEKFAVLAELASALSGAVGASRAAVDAGYASHDMQVGQTGKTVNPNLYIACGVSGSIQHMAGMRTSKVIVAINTDVEAPIFTVADYGIVADLFEAVPLFTEKVKAICS